MCENLAYNARVQSGRNAHLGQRCASALLQGGRGVSPCDGGVDTNPEGCAKGAAGQHVVGEQREDAVVRRPVRADEQRVSAEHRLSLPVVGRGTTC